MGYINAAALIVIVWVNCLSNFHGRHWKPHHLCSRVRYVHSRSSKVVDFGSNRKRLWDFQLVINSTPTLGFISHRFWDIGDCELLVENRQLTTPSTHSHLAPSVGVTPFGLLETLNNSDTRVIHRVGGRYFVILAGVILTQYSSVTDRQIDRQTPLI